MNYFCFYFIRQNFQDFHLIFCLKIFIQSLDYFNSIFMNFIKVLAPSLHILSQIVKNQLINTKQNNISVSYKILILIWFIKNWFTYLAGLIFIDLFNLYMLTSRKNCSEIFGSIVFNTYNWFSILQPYFLPFIFFYIFEIFIQNTLLWLQFERFCYNIFVVGSWIWNNTSISI